MKYVSLDVRIGHALLSAMTSNRIDFHDAVVRQLFPHADSFHRLGVRHRSAFDYDQIAAAPEYIKKIVETALQESRVTAQAPSDAILYDFTANQFDLIRDAVILHLGALIERLSIEGICEQHVILLPRLPTRQAASMMRCESVLVTAPQARILVVAHNGTYYSIGPAGSPGLVPPPDFSDRMDTLLGSPSRNIREKLVRRLGHFRRTGADGCRQYSYFMEDSATELLALMRAWWMDRGLSATGIVYHSPSNPSLAIAAKTLAQERGLAVLRSEDILQSIVRPDPTGRPTYGVVMDVVDSGSTLLNLTSRLEELGVAVHRQAFAAIVKGGGREIEVGPYRIHGALPVAAETRRGQCAQCTLKLPFIADAEESFLRLRAHDMWHMALEVGWEREPDIPDVDGFAYPMIPDFPAMLRDYGDWISYKMTELLKTVPHPESFFVIHPDEPSAVALSSKLRVRYQNRLAIVKVPRHLIRHAVGLRNDWNAVLRLESADDEWMTQLRSISEGRSERSNDIPEPSALIVDIFNASGSTFRSLYELLRYFNVSAFAYFPMVDRDPLGTCGESYPVEKLTLYEWYGPRCLVRKAYEAAI